MRGVDILAKFLSMFPQYIDTIKNWEPIDSKNILVGLKNGSEVKFGYNGDNNWSISQR